MTIVSDIAAKKVKKKKNFYRDERSIYFIAFKRSVKEYTCSDDRT